MNEKQVIPCDPHRNLTLVYTSQPYGKIGFVMHCLAQSQNLPATLNEDFPYKFYKCMARVAWV